MTQSEQVTVHTLDVVAGMVSTWLARAKERKANSQLAAKTWDLKAAYKQLPLSDDAFERDSFSSSLIPGMSGLLCSSRGPFPSARGHL